MDSRLEEAQAWARRLNQILLWLPVPDEERERARLELTKQTHPELLGRESNQSKPSLHLSAQ